ncbi:hypothetical protein [Microbulbifer taiwanensis]
MDHDQEDRFFSDCFALEYIGLQAVVPALNPNGFALPCPAKTGEKQYKNC